MVNALLEAWRVLIPEGTLIDTRPLPKTCLIELVIGESVWKVGEVDAHGMVDDDLAADKAVKKVVEEGRFLPSQVSTFDFELYWNSIDNMASFIKDSRRMRQVTLDYQEIERLRKQLDKDEGETAQVRCRRTTLLAIYSKADGANT